MSVCVLGSINLDHVLRVARLPGPGETLMADGLDRYAGGKGANQALAAAAWGAATALIGAVGRDEAGERLIAHLEGRGVDVAGVTPLADAPSGQALICVSAAGESMIVVVGGANRALTPSHVDAADAAGHRVFLAQLETPTEAIETLFSGVSARRGVRILNAAPAVEAGRALFPLADIVVVNEGELARFTGVAEPTDPADAITPARRLIARSDQTVIVTLGAAGALAVTPEGHVLVAGRPATVEDTTGAGDCFCGVLAAGLDEGCSLPDAMAWANAAAALSTESAGAAVPASLRADTKARYRGGTG